MFLKYVLSQGLSELAAGNDSRNEPQSNALLRTTLRLLHTSESPPAHFLYASPKTDNLFVPQST